MAQSKDKQKKKKETARPCVCGRPPCAVKHKSRHMIACPDMLTCGLRGRWRSNEQDAIIDWNTTVNSAKCTRK